MNTIIDLANTIFKPLIDLGAAPLMTIVLTLIALCFKVKPTRALEGGLKLGIALTGISAIIGILTTAFSDAMASFVERTGISLNITDESQSGIFPLYCKPCNSEAPSHPLGAPKAY